MARRGRGSKKGRSALPKKARRPQKPSKLKTGRGARRSQRASARQPNSRLRELDAVNIYRQGKVKTVSAAARAAGTTLKAMWNLVPRVIEKDPRTGRLRIKASDPYSENVEVLTNAGALVVRARGSRQRQLAGQHRATYMDVVRGKKPASALQQFRGRKVGGHELLSDYERLRTLARAGVLGQLDALYVSAGGGR